MGDLTESGREELALALLLWKDFKCQGKLDVKVTIQLFEFADDFGVRAEVEKMMSRLPPMIIKPAV